MNRWQKIAWFNLIVVATAFVTCSIMAAGMPLKEAITPPSPLTFVVVPALVLVAISEKMIFRKKSNQVDVDERDKQIHMRCRYAGWTAFASSVAAGIMICYFAVGPKGALYPLVLPLLVLIGGGVHIIVTSSAALIQYGRRERNE